LRLGEELARADEEILWVVVDGFIMFWDERVDSMLDVRIFLRVPAQVLKQRREIRQTYVLQSKSVALLLDQFRLK
jgi:nicotinamide/nicotinate riboside kinase